MTDTPTTEEVAAPEETLGEKIQHEAQVLSEIPLIKDANDAIDHVEEVIDEKLHRHLHEHIADETLEEPTAE